MNLVPRFLQVWISGAIIAIAVLAGTVQTAVIGVSIGPFIAVALGVLVSPAMVRGARTGVMQRPVAWMISGVGMGVPILATLQLDPTKATYLSVSWYSCGVLAGAMLVWLSGQRAPAFIGVASLFAHTVAWAGLAGFLRLGVAAEILLLAAMLAIYRTIRLVAEAAEQATAQERRLIIWQAEQDAVHLERRQRLQIAGTSALPLLHRIIESGCALDEATVEECRVLEQTIRDEIRGRRLLNDEVRAAIHEHRSRGRTVQVLDDGGLDDLSAVALWPLLNELAEQLRPLHSQRIIIRTAHADSTSAISIVATSPGPGNSGLLDDDSVDLWTTIARPIDAEVAALKEEPQIAR